MENPVNLNEKRLASLIQQRTRLLGELAEVNMAIQRLDPPKPKYDLNYEPTKPKYCEGCTHCLGRRGTIEFQASQQSDQKQLATVPYPQLLQ